MRNLHIKLVDVPGQDAWTAELRDGFPGSPGALVLADTKQQYTRAQLERDGDPLQPGGLALKMDLDSVLKDLRNDEQPNKRFKRAGLRLFELLQSTGVAAPWMAQRANGTRTYLELPESLSGWPWELLHEPGQRGLARPFFDKPNLPIVRVTPQTRLDLTWSGSTVRILLVSGQAILDSANQIKAADELRDIRKIFHQAGLSVMVELCESPSSRQDLENAIHGFSPHVIHYIGHGDRPPGGDYHLKFASFPWTADDAFRFFDGETWKPRLVVLNACHGAQFDLHAASVAEGLLQAGIPAVIGAVAAFRVDYARVLANQLYSALAQRKPVDKALTAARVALAGIAQYAGFDRRHWALPILTVSAPPEEILKWSDADPRVKLCPVVKKLYRRAAGFADHVTDRARILSAFQPTDETAEVRGVILHSDVETGKSWLVLRSIRDFVDAGYIVRYTNLTKKGAGRTSIDVLADWRGGIDPNSPLLGPLGGTHFDAFDEAYRKASQNPTTAGIRAVFDTFKQGLKLSRGTSRVLLIIDEFRNDASGKGVPASDFLQGLMEQLLLPIQKGDSELDGVYALLVARRYTGREAGEVLDEDEFGLARLNLFLRHPVRDFQATQADIVFDEFSDFQRSQASDALRQYFSVQAGTCAGHKILEMIERPVESLGGNS
jgi:hypothetical protein